MRQKDWRGTPLQVGVTILYTTHMGTMTWVTEALVNEVKKDHLVVTPVRSTREPGKKPGTRQLRIRAVDRITVLAPV
jgi:hypothetical protein